MSIVWFEHKPHQQIHTGTEGNFGPYEADGDYAEPVVTVYGSIGTGNYIRLPAGLPAPFVARQQARITASQPRDCLQCNSRSRWHTLDVGLLVVECAACGFLYFSASQMQTLGLL